MRRRWFARSLGQGLGRLFRRPQIGISEFMPALQRANQLMMIGDYPGAAAIFDELARQVEQFQGPRAPFLFLQAGRAYILMGRFSTGMQHFKHGLSLLGEAKRYNQLYRSATRISQELKTRGLGKEAQEISALVRMHTSAIAELATERLSNTRPALPTHCSACGGPVRSDEVDWIDEVSAECQYCGSPVRSGQ
jgi:hypothetical protein